MIGAYSADQVRAAERPALTAGMGAELMYRAAFGLAVKVLGELRARRGRVSGTRVAALVGKGNNGGDGLWALALLARHGVAVTAVLVDAAAHAEGLRAVEAAGGQVLRLAPSETDDDGGPGTASSLAGVREQCLRADILIDAILGTGARGGLRGGAAELVEFLVQDQDQDQESVRGGLRALDRGGIPQEGRRRTRARGTAVGLDSRFPLVVACDVPSGVDASTGEQNGPVLRAGLTVTFAAAKAGLLLPPGAAFAGRVETVPLGVEDDLRVPVARRLEADDLSRLLPRPSAAGHKYTRGVLGVVAGSEEYPGAAILACSGALSAGAGMVRFFGPASVAAVVNAALPEVVCHSGPELQGRVQAWVLGPGVSGEGQPDRCRQALGLGQPAVVDAGALDLIGQSTEEHPEVILTPHAGELARLLTRLGVERERADVESRAQASLLEAVRLTGRTILLKGPHTLCCEPGGTLYSQADGTPWLATAGSGDVLAGALGALLAQGGGAPSSGTGTPADGGWAATAALAAAVHGRAGRIASGEAAGGAGRPITARDVARAVRLVWDAP